MKSRQLGCDTLEHDWSSNRGEAVVDEEVGAVYEAGFIACEIERGLGYILGFADAALLGSDGGLRYVDA